MSPRPPPLARMYWAALPIPSGNSVISGVQMRTRGRERLRRRGLRLERSIVVTTRALRPGNPGVGHGAGGRLAAAVGLPLSEASDSTSTSAPELARTPTRD